jgi:hypothetical protein
VSRAYYEEMVKTLPERDVIRFVHGRFGYSNAGKPVYPEFHESRHAAKEPLKILPGVPLCAGLDQGLSPAIVLFQPAGNGQLRFLGEVVPPHGTGPARFAELVLGLLNEPRFRGVELGPFTADPAGFYGADKIGGESAWAEAVSKAIGVPIMPAPTQDLGLRIDALRIPLSTMIDATTPALIVDPSCRFLRGGFAAHYQFARQRQGTKDVYADRPVKNAWSHPLEAAQYGVLGQRGRAGVLDSAARAGRPGLVTRHATRQQAPGEFNVWTI